MQIALLIGVLFATNQAQDQISWGTRADGFPLRGDQQFMYFCEPGGTNSDRLGGTESNTYMSNRAGRNADIGEPDNREATGVVILSEFIYIYQ